MTNFSKWSDVRADLVANVGDEEALVEARQRNQAFIEEHQLAQRRRPQGSTQTDKADLIA